MNALDIVISVIIVFCLVRGCFRGIIKEMTSVVGVFVGFYAAYTYYPLVGEFLSFLITDKAYLDIASFILTFTLLYAAIGLVAIVLKHILKSVALGWADRILGGVVGLVKAVLVVSVLMVPLTAFLPAKAPVIKNSLFAPTVIVMSDKMVAVVPKEMKQKFEDNFDSLKKVWKKL